ncbi:MAG TPA: phytanoyl-CoA dioxygenase family protein [Candidatus Polarisedimenticolaceae bacterium]|nr:phytanoyl-CoA dioxygenase family protein [Candidatus Polarisedimenticolaceae bacterium]
MRELSDKQVREFFEDGFVVVPQVFSAREVAYMQSAFDRLERLAQQLAAPTMLRGSQFVVERTSGDVPRVRIHRIVWCGAAAPVLSYFGCDQRLVHFAAQLLGSSTMSQLINQAHFKLPGDGVSFPWHQDSTHRRYGQAEWCDVNGRGSYVQIATALDDVTAESGPIEFIRGSGRLGHLGLTDGALPSTVDPSQAVAPTPRAGDVILFGPYTIHRSLPNRSAHPRRTFINGFAYPGANSRVYPGEGAGRLLTVEGDAA